MAYSEDVNVNLNVLAGTMGGITAIMGGMSALTSSFGAMGTEAANSFGILDGLLVTSTTLIASFATQSAEAFGEYEQGMKIVQTVSNQTGSAMNELSNKANEMSITYRTAIGDITDGLQTLGRAGLNSVSEQLEVLESGLQTAKLEGRNLNSVLEELIQNTAMLGGDLKSTNFGEQTEYVNSLLVGTSMTAPITSHDISQTLQYAGGTAAAAGANLENKDKLEDLMGTVAAFAQKGVTGSMAGTALRAFFTKPASQDASVTKGLEAIGLSPNDLWENGGEEMKSVSDQIGIIQRQMDKLNMSTMDQIEIWGKIVGAKMGQQMMKLDSSSIKDLTRDIQSAQNAEDLATQTLQTYTQKIAEMQQEGELAFREFGEKAAFWLTPVVEVISWVLDKLSNPWVNVGVFTIAGSFLAHGFRKAYSMISTVWTQIKGLIGDAISGIETISGMASGPVAGFTQSASAVEILNARLAQTNTELAQMQAQFMGIKAISGTGTAVIPLGLTDKNGKLPVNILGTANQNVFRGNGSMIGGQYLGIGERGRYYDASEIKKLTNDYKQSIQAFNKGQQDIIKQQKAAMTYTKLNGEQVYLNDKGANMFAAYTKQFDTMTRAKAEFEGRQLANNPTWIMSSKQVDEHLAKQYPMISNQTVEDNIKKFTKAGEMQVHSSLTSMTDAQFKDWEKRMNQSVHNLRAFESGNKSVYYDHQGKFDYEKFNQDQLNKENLRRHNDLVSRSPHLATKTYIDEHGNEQKFHRVNSMSFMKEYMWEENIILQKEAQLKQYEQGRMNVMQQQRARASGVGQGMATKGQQMFTQRMQSYSNWINKATTSTKNFVTSGITKAGRSLGVLSLNTESMRNKFTAALTSIEKRMETAPITFEEALVEIQETLGVSAIELGAMLTETSLGFEKFNTQLMGLGLKTVNDEIATEEHTEALLVDKAAAEKSALSKLKDSGISLGKSAIGFMGGSFMAGMLAVTFAMQAIQSSQQDWQKKMQKLNEQISETQEKLQNTEDTIKEAYKDESGDDTELGAQNALIDKYAEIYDSSRDQSIKLDENTAELMRNTESLKNKIDATNDVTMDKIWGVGQWGSEFSDRLGTLSTWTTDFLSDIGDLFSLKYNTSDRSWFNINENPNGADFGVISGGFERTSGEGYFSNHNIVMTAAQRDDNYPWLQEFAPLLSADIWDMGIEQGFKQAFGGDFNKITDILESVTGKNDMDAWNSTAFGTQAQNINTVFKSAEDQNRLQYALKNYQTDFTNLGYQTRFFEKASGGKSAYGTFMQGKGKSALQDSKGFKALTKAGNKDTQRLINYIKSLSIKTGMTEQQVLMAAQLQQLQDMQAIANDVVTPQMLAQTEQAIAMAQYGGAINSHMPGTESGALTAGKNARAIAALLNVEMEGKLQEGLQRGISEDTSFTDEERARYAGMSASEVYAAGITAYNQDPNSKLGKAFARYYLTPYASVNSQSQGASAAYGQSYAEQWVQGLDTDAQHAISTLRKGAIAGLEKNILDAYDTQATQANTPSENNGSGGSGDGSGSGSDSGSGSTKSRVDLVLCSKKQIPKLDVNLFKKAPNFTIKNKQFNVRDIKITSQDKPDAITDAIKNGIISAQKRMDPKIIQSDEAVYDPVAATDGTTPSGTMPVETK